MTALCASTSDVGVSMKFGVPWSVKGIRPDVRETAREAARRSGMSLGEWLNSVILQQAEDEGLHPGQDNRDDDDSYSDELAGVHRRLDEITRRINQFTRSAAHAPRQNRDDQPDRIAELIARLDRRLEQFVNAARPAPAPMAYAPAPAAPPAMPAPPLVPNVQLPPALDRAIAEITARQRTLNEGGPARPQPRQPAMAPPPFQYAPPPGPAPAPLPAQDLSGLEEQLRRITDQIETLRRPGVEEAINALRGELKDIGRALDDAMPRRALETIEGQIQDLSRRIAEGKQNGADGGALAGIERGLAEVRDALRGLTPAENLVGFHEAVDALAHKIDLIVAQRDPATMQQLEHAITTLREMAAHVASDEALRKLAAQVQALGEKIEQMSAGPSTGDALSNLGQRIDALGRALAERAQNGGVVPPRLEALVESLSDKIEQVQQSRGDAVAAGHLEDRIVKLVERLDASDTRLTHLEAIERGLADLLVNIQDMRAAKDAEAQHAPDQSGIDAIKHDIARTQNALDAVNGTLGLVVDRLASIENDIRGDGGRRPAGGHNSPDPGPSAGKAAAPADPPRMPPAPSLPAPAPVAAPARAPAPQQRPPQAATAPAPKRMPPANHGPIDPDLPPDQPLEPGSGPPRQRAGARIAASEAALGSARPAPPAGGKSSFIAAARRAAQTAVQEATNRLPSAAEPAENGGETTPSLPNKMMKKVKSLFIAASIAAIAVGSVQIVGNIFTSGPKTPVKTAKVPGTAITLSDIPPPLSAKNADRVPSITAMPPAGGNIAAALPPLDFGQNTPAMPPLLSPPALNTVVTAPAPANDITGSIPRPAVTAKPAQPQAVLPPAAGERLPIAIGSVRLRNAAAGGDAAAAYEIAARYAEGRGVPANLAEAARWYERAASKGLTPAQFRYASFLEKGQGVKKDLTAARRLYLAAAAKGNAKAMHNLAVLYAEGIDGRPDYATAAQWFQKAAQHGVADSQYNLGVLAARGLGLEKNLVDSYKWFALAAAQGDKEAARKRDEVAAELDAPSRADALQAVKTFVATPQPREATTVRVPPGGWDDPAEAPSAQGKARPSGSTTIGAYRLGKR